MICFVLTPTGIPLGSQERAATNRRWPRGVSLTPPKVADKPHPAQCARFTQACGGGRGVRKQPRGRSMHPRVASRRLALALSGGDLRVFFPSVTTIREQALNRR